MSDRPHVDASPRVGALREGVGVAVRCRFDGSWIEGFEIAGTDASDEHRFWLRRRLDHTVLPATFHEHDLRVGGETSRDTAWTPGKD